MQLITADPSQCAANSSSLTPSQSSSIASQVASLAEGVPGVHESTMAPDTHDVLPDDTHGPTPQVVACGT